MPGTVFQGGCIFFFFFWVDSTLHSRQHAFGRWFQIKWPKHIFIILLCKAHSSYWQMLNYQINKFLSQTFKSNDWLLSLWNSYIEQVKHWPRRVINESIFHSFFKSNIIFQLKILFDLTMWIWVCRSSSDPNLLQVIKHFGHRTRVDWRLLSSGQTILIHH